MAIFSQHERGSLERILPAQSDLTSYLLLLESERKENQPLHSLGYLLLIKAQFRTSCLDFLTQRLILTIISVCVSMQQKYPLHSTCTCNISNLHNKAE